MKETEIMVNEPSDRPLQSLVRTSSIEDTVKLGFLISLAQVLLDMMSGAFGIGQVLCGIGLLALATLSLKVLLDLYEGALTLWQLRGAKQTDQQQLDLAMQGASEIKVIGSPGESLDEIIQAFVEHDPSVQIKKEERKGRSTSVLIDGNHYKSVWFKGARYIIVKTLSAGKTGV